MTSESSPTPDPIFTDYVLLPVYEGRRGNTVAQVAVSARHEPRLIAWDLTYWFLGDKRGRFPCLRRTLQALNQHGEYVPIHLYLHRLIAVARHFDQDLPEGLQQAHDLMCIVPAYSVFETQTPLAVDVGFDYRDDNIVPTVGVIGRKDRPIRHGPPRKYLETLEIHQGRREPSPRPQKRVVSPEDALRQMALDAIADEDFRYALPGDTAEEATARREAGSMADVLALMNAGSDVDAVRRITGKPIAKIADVADDLPEGFIDRGEK